jgi:hypothetical protein
VGEAILPGRLASQSAGGRFNTPQIARGQSGGPVNRALRRTVLKQSPANDRRISRCQAGVLQTRAVLDAGVRLRRAGQSSAEQKQGKYENSFHHLSPERRLISPPLEKARNSPELAQRFHIRRIICWR